MSWILNVFRMPLLGKELMERASRRQTYVLRVLYLLGLFGIFALAGAQYQIFISQFNQPERVLAGTGRMMFQALIFLQLGGIYLFLPVMMCGAIASEKEKDSLSLLLLTPLSPWQIIWQKYLAGVVPMLTYLLAALPMAAVAYSYGGMELDVIGWGIWVLLLTVFQVAALVLMSSARARTARGTLLRSYIMGCVLYFGPALVVDSDLVVERSLYEELGFCFIPVVVVFEAAKNSAGSKWLWSIPTLASIVFCLVRARVNLTKFAFQPPARRLKRLFKWMDGLFHQMNVKAGGVVLMKDQTDLPGEKPILWYESRQRVLGRPQYLLRMALALLIPIGCVIVYVLAKWSGGLLGTDTLMVWTSVIGGLAFVVSVTQGAGSFASERGNQTLDVLLTTRISARTIVLEKMQALRRLAWVFMGAVLLLLLTARIIEWDIMGSVRSFSPENRLACSIATVFVYTTLVCWVSMWIGMIAVGRFKATLIAFGAFVVWCIAPAVVAELVLPLVFGRSLMMTDDAPLVHLLVSILSPIYIPILNEAGIPLPQIAEARELQWIVLLVNFGLYGGIAMRLRYLCLTRADRYLRR